MVMVCCRDSLTSVDSLAGSIACPLAVYVRLPCRYESRSKIWITHRIPQGIQGQIQSARFNLKGGSDATRHANAETLNRLSTPLLLERVHAHRRREMTRLPRCKIRKGAVIRRLGRVAPPAHFPIRLEVGTARSFPDSFRGGHRPLIPRFV
jgi:hypothetical protein